MMPEWVDIVVSVLSGLIVAIPLVVKLVEYVQKAAKEKNWGNVLELVTNLMQEAENKFDNGLERKEWVLMMIKASADTINYDINIEQISKMIDSLTAMSKVVNAPVVEEVSESELPQ